MDCGLMTSTPGDHEHRPEFSKAAKSRRCSLGCVSEAVPACKTIQQSKTGPSGQGGTCQNFRWYLFYCKKQGSRYFPTLLFGMKCNIPSEGRSSESSSIIIKNMDKIATKWLERLPIKTSKPPPHTSWLFTRHRHRPHHHRPPPRATDENKRKLTQD